LKHLWRDWKNPLAKIDLQKKPFHPLQRGGGKRAALERVFVVQSFSFYCRLILIWRGFFFLLLDLFLLQTFLGTNQLSR
jgi:hypothetical protein